MTMTSTTTTDRPRRSTSTGTRPCGWPRPSTAATSTSCVPSDPDDWSRPTDCPAWDVRAMAAHNLGMAEMAGSLPEMVRQFAAATPPDGGGRRRPDRPPGGGRAGADARPEIIERYAAAVSAGRARPPPPVRSWSAG